MGRPNLVASLPLSLLSLLSLPFLSVYSSCGCIINPPSYLILTRRVTLRGTSRRSLSQGHFPVHQDGKEGGDGWMDGWMDQRASDSDDEEEVEGAFHGTRSDASAAG